MYQYEKDNYNYERGIYSTIDLAWNKEEETLTLHKRKGSYPGMIKDIIFKIHVIGYEVKTVIYSGEEIIVRKDI